MNQLLKNASCIAGLLWLGASIASAASTLVNPQPGYVANDVVTSVNFTGYDASGSSVYGWNGSSLAQYDVGTGALVNDFGGVAGYTGSAFNSFVTLAPGGDSAWVGFTVGGNTDDRIYEVNLNTGVWTQRATLAGNFDLAFSGGNPFVSATNSTSFLDPNQIWLLDTSGSDAHDSIATVGGNSAGLAFDSAGNLIYATADLSGGTNELIRYTNSQVIGAIGGTSLTLGDAASLSGLAAAAYDVVVDDAGNVYLSVNDFGNSEFSVLRWDGNSGSGDNTDEVATAVGFIGGLDADGDIEGDNGELYVNRFSNGLAAVTVPEPTTGSLILGSGLLLLAARRRRQG